MEKKWIILIILIVFSAAFAVYRISNDISNLEKATNTLDEIEKITKDQPFFVQNFDFDLRLCDHTEISEDSLNECKETIKKDLEDCDYYGNPPICKDTRIEKIMSMKPTPYTQTSELAEVKNPTRVSVKTYTNVDYNFSIDFPAHWDSREISSSYFPEEIVRFSDNDETKFGLPSFLLKKDNNEFATHFESVQAYKKSLEQFSIGLGKITIDSENKMTINDVDAYELKYKIKMQVSESAKPNYCDGTAFVFDTIQNNLIFEYLTCENPLYYDFVPIFERMAQSFKKLS